MTYPKSVNSYAVGFILSLLLTVAAYLFVVEHLLAGEVLIFAIVCLAIIQFYVQAIFFLHLGRGYGALMKFWLFALTVVIIAVFIGGTIWIMYDLNYHMTPEQINSYLNDQGSF